MAEPYADELFPENAGGKPFADDLFPESVDHERERAALGASPLKDFIFGNTEKFSAARILNHFGQGVSDAWGASGGLTTTKEAVDYMRSSGWFGDYTDGQTSILKAANEALFRPAAALLVGGGEALIKGTGALFAGAQNLVAKTGEDLGYPQLGRDLAAIPEALQGSPHPTGVPKVAVSVPMSEQLLLRARAANIIGAGEEGWKGTAPTPEAKAAAISVRPTPAGTSPIEQTFANAEGASPIEQALANPPAEAPIHTVARGIAPDLFYRYDEVQARRDTLKAQSDELSAMRAKDAAQAQEIADLRAKVQERIVGTETEARELAPAVKEAYAEANKSAPEEPVKPVLTEEAAPEPRPTPEGAKPIEQQRAFIQNDIKEKLIAAGRPETEAAAAAAIDAAYWETRAERFNGAKGTAEEMYRREAPEILGPGMQSDYQKPRAKPKRENITLTQFIAQRGGIADNDPLIADVRSIIGKKNLFIPGFGPLIRKGGKYLDNHREAAAEADYIPRKTSIRTLLDTMRDEDKNRPTDKPGFDVDLNRHEIETALDNSLREIGLGPDAINPEVHARAVQILEEGKITDPLDAYEKAEGEAGLFQKEWNRGQNVQPPLGAQPESTTPSVDANLTTMLDEAARAKVVAAYNDELPSIKEQYYNWAGKDRSYEVLTAKEAEETFGDRKDWPAELAELIDKHGRAVEIMRGQNQMPEWFAPDAAPTREAFMRETVEEMDGLLPASDLDDIMRGLDSKTDGAELAASKAFKEMAKALGWEPKHGGRYFFIERELAEGERSPLDRDAEPGDTISLKVRISDHGNTTRNPNAPRGAQRSNDINLAPGAHDFDDAARIMAEAVEQKSSREPAQSIPGSEPRTTAGAQPTAGPSIRQTDESSQGGPGKTGASAVWEGGAFDPASPNILEQAGDIKRGKIILRENGRNTIRMLEDSNASTFIHEKGHDYLHRLMRDALDKDAPLDLKADADTVLKWLGVEKAADIKTRHHEKFARGFENYVMEGRAPSHALARVFEQFRQWLVRIYTEAKRLKAPLNDDIRGVFDRMLAVKPEDVVIAPDRASEHAAGRVEANFEAVPPPEARGVAGEVQAERDTLAGQLPPEKQDARLAEIRAGIEGRAPRGAEPNGDGNVAGPVAEGPGVGAQPAADGAGRGEASAEAPSMGAGAKPAGASVKTGTPGSPHEPFNLTGDAADKAGNIRLDLLNAPEDVKAIISQVADENAQFQSVRGPVTDIQVAELADAMGMDAAYLSTRKLGEAWTAPQIVALRNLLIQSATNVRDLMAKAAQGDEAAILAYAEAKTRHMMIQERVSSVTAEAGRALRAFQGKFTGMGDAKALGDFLKKETGQTLFQIQREAQLGMSLETPSQVSKFIQDSKKATFPQMIQEFWINALLSGPITHVKNMIGNTAVAVLSPIETAATAGVGKVRQILGSDAERVRLGEAKAELFGMVQGAQDGLIAAKYAFMHEDQYTRAQTIEQPKYQAIPSKRVVLKTYEPGSPEYQARIESFAQARARAERLTGEKLEARIEELKTNPTPDMVAEAGEKAIEIGGKQIRTPGRLLTAEDELFKNIAYRQNINKLAFRHASNEGLTGDAFNSRVARLTTDPPEEMMTAATKAADYQTFTNSLGDTGRAIQMFANSHLLAKMVVPFVRTPLNLLKYANERTPLGVFSREVRANLSGVNGKIAQDTQIARMAVGTSIAVAAMYMADQGMITGAGPSDKNEKAALMLSGWRPYSIKIGDTYYAYNWLDPFSTIMSIAADLGDAYKVSGEVEDDQLGKVGLNLFGSIMKTIRDKSTLRGASDLMNAVTDVDRNLPRYLRNLAGSFVPATLAQQAKAHDEFQREARTLLDTIKSRVRGLRTDLMPKRDVWGEPIKLGENLGPDSFSPVAMSKLTNDRATQALLDAEVFPATLPRKIRGIELTDQQYDDFARVAGRMAKMRVNAIVSNPGFDNAPVNVRHDLLKKTIDSSRESARSLLMMQNPSIIKQALDNKLESVGR